MLLDSARQRLRKEQIMKYDVTVKTIPERYAATVQMVIPHYEDEGMLWNMLGECKTPLVPADPCLHQKHTAHPLDQHQLPLLPSVCPNYFLYYHLLYFPYYHNHKAMQLSE